MSRLEKKCLMASAAMHGLVVLLLCLAPLLWAPRHRPVVLPPINFIPSRLLDGVMNSGGGSPSARALPAPAQPAPAPPPAQQQTAPSRPAPKVATPVPKATEPAPAEKKMAKAEPTDVHTAKPTSRKIEISLKRERGTASKVESAAAAQARAEARARAAQSAYADKVRSIAHAIGQGVSPGTSIESPGPGGEAFADYGQWVQAVYRRAWTPPNNLDDDGVIVEATVIILRDGTVESFKVTKKSRHDPLDRSVERLSWVKTIAPFPQGTPDQKRTFIIEFNLRSETP